MKKKVMTLRFAHGGFIFAAVLSLILTFFDLGLANKTWMPNEKLVWFAGFMLMFGSSVWMALDKENSTVERTSLICMSIWWVIYSMSIFLNNNFSMLSQLLGLVVLLIGFLRNNALSSNRHKHD